MVHLGTNLDVCEICPSFDLENLPKCKCTLFVSIVILYKQNAHRLIGECKWFISLLCSTLFTQVDPLSARILIHLITRLYR